MRRSGEGGGDQRRVVRSRPQDTEQPTAISCHHPCSAVRVARKGSVIFTLANIAVLRFQRRSDQKGKGKRSCLGWLDPVSCQPIWDEDSLIHGLRGDISGYDRRSAILPAGVVGVKIALR